MLRARREAEALRASVTYHMSVELTKSVEVGRGGRVELVVPELPEGSHVDVHVSSPASEIRKPARFGF